MSHEIAPNLIATCGNPLAGDDAMGSVVAARLKPAACPHIEVIDLALDPTRLIGLNMETQTIGQSLSAWHAFARALGGSLSASWLIAGRIPVNTRIEKVHGVASGE